MKNLFFSLSFSFSLTNCFRDILNQTNLLS
nr:MAG TPA: hypothetical protein [Caudoviricetes sp.]